MFLKVKLNAIKKEQFVQSMMVALLSTLAFFDIDERAFAALQQSVIMYYCPHKKDVDLEYCDFRRLKEFPQGCQI